MSPEAALRALREASLELARLRRVRGAYRTTWRRIARARHRLALAAAMLAAAPALAGDPLYLRGPLFDGSVYAATPAFADVDGDGDFDVFVGETYGSTRFFENTGTAGAPAFAAPATNPFGLADVGGASAPVFADLDGDGDLDAFVGEYPGATSHFRNVGTASAPTFTPAPAVLPDVGSFASPAFTDIDADGDLDAFVGNRPGNTLFFRNVGTPAAPAFAGPTTNPFGLSSLFEFASPTFADLDGDGDRDAFSGSIFGVTAHFRNTGSASAPAFAPLAPAPVPHVGVRSGVDFADIDGDGDLDVIVGAYTKTLLFENTGTATAPAFSTGGNPLAGVEQLAAVRPAFADIDADGDLDAFLADDSGRTRFVENTGTAVAPLFAEPVDNPFGIAQQNFQPCPAFADIDGDGDLDAFFGQSDGRTAFRANTGSASAPAFGALLTNPFGLADVGSYAAPSFADVEGDGDLDLFVGEELGRTFFFANTGSASAPAFAAPVTGSFGLAGVGRFRPRPTLADDDGDGDEDVTIGTGDGHFFRYENTGTATAPAFAPGALDPLGLADAGYLPAPAHADLDGDADLDLFVGEYGGGVLFFENAEYRVGACSDGLDNDGDGQPDLGSDPGCADASDVNERSNQQCDNGVDDDGDGKIDWRGDGSGDPHCANLLDGREAPDPPPGCGLGPELVLLAPLLAAVRRRRGSYTARTCPSASPTPRPTSSSSGAR